VLVPPVIRRGERHVLRQGAGGREPSCRDSQRQHDRQTAGVLRLSSDEKKLLDVITRAYLAALMPDFRYRQTTATLDVRGLEFRAAGRQPIDLGWRAAFPDWQPADEKEDEAQLLPPLRNGETAQLQEPKMENKETRPPPRYNEGTLIEAMQNAWRFVDDEAAGAFEGSQGHWYAGDPGLDHQRTEEAGFSYCPEKEYCANRDRPVAVRHSQNRPIRRLLIPA
jgi:DNA topoisomerase III